MSYQEIIEGVSKRELNTIMTWRLSLELTSLDPIGKDSENFLGQWQRKLEMILRPFRLQKDFHPELDTLLRRSFHPVISEHEDVSHTMPRFNEKNSILHRWEFISRTQKNVFLKPVLFSPQKTSYDGQSRAHFVDFELQPSNSNRTKFKNNWF